MSNRIDNIKEYFNSLPEVKRIKELESYIDSNNEINDTFNAIKDIQKKMVNAKEFNQINQYKLYLEEYNLLRDKLMDLPFVEEYLELLEIVNSKLVFLTQTIEQEMNV
ncbi:MAG: YlbF family regulator [Acholeplasmatales bacterium]|nr:YlbF family regulator [Acholeplasmatales bacterium]